MSETKHHGIVYRLYHGETTFPLIQRRKGFYIASIPELQGCHTSFIGDYVVDGHVPVEAINKLLAEHPASKGIALPGMPEGSPGMAGDKAGPFTIYAIGADGQSSIFMKL